MKDHCREVSTRTSILLICHNDHHSEINRLRLSENLKIVTHVGLVFGLMFFRLNTKGTNLATMRNAAMRSANLGFCKIFDSTIHGLLWKVQRFQRCFISMAMCLATNVSIIPFCDYCEFDISSLSTVQAPTNTYSSRLYIYISLLMQQ